MPSALMRFTTSSPASRARTAQRIVLRSPASPAARCGRWSRRLRGPWRRKGRLSDGRDLGRTRSRLAFDERRPGPRRCPRRPSRPREGYPARRGSLRDGTGSPGARGGPAGPPRADEGRRPNATRPAARLRPGSRGKRPKPANGSAFAWRGAGSSRARVLPALPKRGRRFRAPSSGGSRRSMGRPGMRGREIHGPRRPVRGPAASARHQCAAELKRYVEACWTRRRESRRAPS